MSSTHQAVIEIPEGSYNKYELAEDGSLFLDWVMPIPFPSNYGSILHTLGGDGDMLDVHVITDHALPVLSKVEVRVIGVMKMIDNNEEDYKIIAVAAVDQTYKNVTDINQLSEDFKPRIEHFYRHIKQSVHDWRGVPIEIHGWGDAIEAEAIINAAFIN